MSRVISQQTFDDAVRENIDEFSMSANEAVEDAIKQFESQVEVILCHLYFIYT